MARQLYLGLDIGGTKIEGAVAELHHETHTITIFSRKRISTVSPSDFSQFLKSLLGLINDLIDEAEIEINDLAGIGLGLPGSLEPKTKIMLNGNTRHLIGKDVSGELFLALNKQVPVYAENDANLFVFSEAWGGAGKKFASQFKVPFEEQIAVGITLGTGVGGGLFIKGEIFSGVHGAALEVGHIVLNPNGPECYCGQKGCAERYLSGTALNSLEGFANSKILFEEAEKGNLEAINLLADYRKNLLQFLSILNNLFNPHYFVFGGGLSNQEVLFHGLKEELSNNIFLDKKFTPEVIIHHLGDSSGLFGAMIYASEILNS